MDNLLTGDLLSWLGDHQQWLGLAIFLIALLESLAIAGLVIPGVVLLLAVTAMAGGGGMSFGAALVWAFTGAVIGDMLSFALGRFFHQDIRRLGLFRRNPQWIARAEVFFQRYGLFGIFIGRFVGPIRPIIPMVAGMLDMPTLRFVAINLLSALAWAPVYVTPGFVAGRAIKWPVPEFFWEQALTLLGLLAGLLLAVVLILRAQQRWSNLVAGLLCLLALAAVALTGDRLEILQQSFALWLALPSAGWGMQALDAMAPLASPALPVVLLALLTLSLLVSRSWQALALCAMATAACGLLALAVDASLPSSVLAFSLVLVALTALLTNRPHAFWTRAAFMSGVAPAGVLLGAISLVSLHGTLLSLINASLLAATGLLLALWILERGGPVLRPSPPASYLLLWLPLISAIGVLSGLHYL
ncbi:DedA family protein [Halopseudomonas sp.]|uniref:DedA family protein n=1 Tax=Halopseudomonas sp. TaxID=2901191 RepID=UPI003568CF75